MDLRRALHLVLVAALTLSACGREPVAPTRDAGVDTPQTVDAGHVDDAAAADGLATDARGPEARDAVVDAALNPDAAAPDARSALDATATPADAGTTMAARGQALLREGFDTTPPGAVPAAPWQSSPGVVVEEVPFAADHSVALDKAAGVAIASLGTRFSTPLSGRVVIEADVLARETAGFKAIPYVYDEAGAAMASLAFLDGDIVARVRDVVTTVQPFAANVWYRVRLVIDTDRGVFDLFVDGVRKLHDAALRTPSPAVRELRYYLDGAGAGLLRVDDVRVFLEADYIGAPPEPVFDVRDYGATGNDTTEDTAALQRAIDAAAGTGGSVLLRDGTFLSGTLTLGSRMTFFVAPSATLRGTTTPAAYPRQSPRTGNTQLHNCRRALLYAPEVTDLRIDGGGTIDGQGDSFGGRENERPMLVWAVLSQRIEVRNLYLRKGAMWSLVTMESDHVRIADIQLQSNGITHDGLDVVDGRDVVVEDCAIRAGDDAMCLKSGVRRGLEGVIIRRSVFSGDNGGSNGVKFGTASYGAFRDIRVEDVYVKDIKHAAIAVESRQGADVANVAFERVQLADVGTAFFVYLAQQAETAPAGDVPRLGTMDAVSFTDISGWTSSWPSSPHQASLITGHVFEGQTYAITGLSFDRVHLRYTGGRGSVPGDPPEARPNQYPESNMFGDLPASAYFLRHVAGVRFRDCSTRLAQPDPRPLLVTRDVSGLTGSP